MRKFFAVLLSLEVGFAVVGVLVVIVGESYARWQLPPELRTSAVIEAQFDGTVCFDCWIAGVMMLMGGLALSGVTVLMWAVTELIDLGTSKLTRGKMFV